MQRAILDYHFLFRLSAWNDDAAKKEELINDQLEKMGIVYKEASDVVSSKDFWENYFSKNPEKKPSKIVYYQGSDPTSALYAWKKKYVINKSGNLNDIVFEDKKVSKDSAVATSGMDRFKSLASEVINNYFEAKEEVSV